MKAKQNFDPRTPTSPLNHSESNFNEETVYREVDGMPQLAFYAKKDIRKHEFIEYGYNDQIKDESTK